MKTRDGEKIGGVYSGKGYCYVDAGGGRYGLASWFPGYMMNGQGSDRLRPIDQKAAEVIRKAIRYN